jgi:hypothetical protein
MAAPAEDKGPKAESTFDRLTGTQKSAYPDDVDW